MTRGQRLDDLARKLKLTDRERRYCEVTVANPELSKHEALRLAGSGSTSIAILKTSAHQIEQKDRVQRFLAELTREARALAAQRTGETVATAAEIWERMTKRARTSAADFVKFPTLEQRQKMTAATHLKHTVQVRDKDGNVTETREEYNDPRGPYDYVADPDDRLLEDFKFDLPGAFARGLGVCVSAIKFNREGRLELKLVDGAAADEAMARWLRFEERGPEEDPAIAAAREQLRKLLETPAGRQVMDEFSVQLERVHVTVRRERS